MYAEAGYCVLNRAKDLLHEGQTLLTVTPDAIDFEGPSATWRLVPQRRALRPKETVWSEFVPFIEQFVYPLFLHAQHAELTLPQLLAEHPMGIPLAELPKRFPFPLGWTPPVLRLVTVPRFLAGPGSNVLGRFVWNDAGVRRMQARQLDFLAARLTQWGGNSSGTGERQTSLTAPDRELIERVLTETGQHSVRDFGGELAVELASLGARVTAITDSDEMAGNLFQTAKSGDLPITTLLASEHNELLDRLRRTCPDLAFHSAPVLQRFHSVEASLQSAKRLSRKMVVWFIPKLQQSPQDGKNSEMAKLQAAVEEHFRILARSPQVLFLGAN
jgi:hypothetical protein